MTTGNPNTDPEFQAELARKVRHGSLVDASERLLAEQVRVLGELGGLVTRHAYLGGLARRFPELEALQRTAQTASWAVDQTRSMESNLGSARVEIIEAIAAMDAAE